MEFVENDFPRTHALILIWVAHLRYKFIVLLFVFGKWMDIVEVRWVQTMTNQFMLTDMCYHSLSPLAISSRPTCVTNYVFHHVTYVAPV